MAIAQSILEEFSEKKMKLIFFQRPEWLRESENTHNPEMWVVIDVLTKEQKELVDFVQESDVPVKFEFTLEN